MQLFAIRSAVVCLVVSLSLARALGNDATASGSVSAINPHAPAIRPAAGTQVVEVQFIRSDAPAFADEPSPMAPSASVVESINAARLQVIVAEPSSYPFYGERALPSQREAILQAEGVPPLAPSDACMFLPPDCGPRICVPRDFWLFGDRLYFMADMITLKRDQSGSEPFAALGTPSDVVLRTEQRDFPFRYGLRTLAGITLTPLTRVEGVYLGLTNWMDTAAIRDDSPNSLGGTGNLLSRLTDFGDPPVSGIDFNNFASINYRSVLDNIELNLRHRLITPPWMEVSVLFGGRYISVRERFDYFTVAGSPGPLDTINAVDARTGNDLIGGQIGGTFNAPIEDAWWIQFEIKGAICQNNAGQTTLYTNTDNAGVTENFTGGKRQTGSAFVGDLALSLFCQCTDHIAIRLGYQALWIDGLALASENVPRDVNVLTLGPAGLVEDGRVVYHGPHAGMMLSW